jgi:hypothetical protein
MLAIGACSTRDLPQFDGGANDAADDATACAFCTDASFDASSTGPPDAIAPPAVACVDAGDGGAECPLPPSVCANSLWLEYFDNGTCVDAGCSFDVAFHVCNYGCWDGGCLPYNGTKAQ